ncbi:MAG: cytochrome d ubiquinol oxidase subunit II [Candidatus Latescibacteria bacterium]|nr:cytochrome d ubiquinol oxidase subunit II [Candidatus Latescibacterota bacterium]
MGLWLIVWFFVLGIMVTAYVIVGGTRLGFGLWYLFAPSFEREYILKALKPHIDGSELWIVLAGSSLYILFPWIYNVVFSGFYPIISVIAAVLGFRIVALLVRNILRFSLWRSFWDVLISLCSLIPIFLIGIITGYILKGVPLYSVGRFNINILGYISHYTIVTGLMILFGSAILSCTAIAWNSDGITRIRSRKWAFYSSLILCVLMVDLTIWSLNISPYISANIRANPYLFVIPATTFITAIEIPVLLYKQRFMFSYVLTVVVMTGLALLFFVSIYPHLKTIFFESRPNLPVKFEAMMELRKKMLPVYIVFMAAVIALQILIFRTYRQHVHCPLPHDEEDYSLL